MNTTTMTLWQPDGGDLVPPDVKTPKAITEYATQLSSRERRQIIAAFEAEHYEMGLNFLWLRTVTALKRDLASVGLGLLGEMLGRVGVNEDDDVEDLLTAPDAIRLAEELGVINPTQALRLRHTHEIVTHFNQPRIREGDDEGMDDSEAIASLKVCVKAVLAKPSIEVARKFVEFREDLESKSFVSDEDGIDRLLSSPYFFLKLTVGILMNSAKNSTGAKLEHCLANTNVLIPRLWRKLTEAEKWQVGRTYAEVYSDGKKTSASGLKQALMKVRGFDFVPENLRSDTFVKAAEAILRAHDGMNNFYNEPSPTRSLVQLGTSIPIPALPACMSALLSVVLGNAYGVSWEASSTASHILRGVGEDRWKYYLNQILPTDSRILNKLALDRPLSQWMVVVGEYGLAGVEIKNSEVSKLVRASTDKSAIDVRKSAAKLLRQYYGRNERAQQLARGETGNRTGLVRQ